eukprot:1140754-Pelagomonas_calceolata.AAC.2
MQIERANTVLIRASKAGWSWLFSPASCGLNYIRTARRQNAWLLIHIECLKKLGKLKEGYGSTLSSVPLVGKVFSIAAVHRMNLTWV